MGSYSGVAHTQGGLILRGGLILTGGLILRVLLSQEGFMASTPGWTYMFPGVLLEFSATHGIQSLSHSGLVLTQLLSIAGDQRVRDCTFTPLWGRERHVEERMG